MHVHVHVVPTCVRVHMVLKHACVSMVLEHARVHGVPMNACAYMTWPQEDKGRKSVSMDLDRVIEYPKQR